MKKYISMILVVILCCILLTACNSGKIDEQQAEINVLKAQIEELKKVNEEESKKEDYKYTVDGVYLGTTYITVAEMYDEEIYIEIAKKEKAGDGCHFFLPNTPRKDYDRSNNKVMLPDRNYDIAHILEINGVWKDYK